MRWCTGRLKYMLTARLALPSAMSRSSNTSAVGISLPPIASRTFSIVRGGHWLSECFGARTGGGGGGGASGERGGGG